MGKEKNWQKYTFGPYILGQSYFGPYFDFATIPVPKNRKSILFWSFSSTY